MVIPFFFFNDTATTEIYTLSLHDALPISIVDPAGNARSYFLGGARVTAHPGAERSEEHTSELQSQSNLVCRLLLEKKKTYSSPNFDSCNLSSHLHQNNSNSPTAVYSLIV